MLDLAGVKAHPDYPLDGMSLAPVLRDPSHTFARPMYWRMNHRGQRALRDGDWKYLRVDGNDYLFNVPGDARERADEGRRPVDLGLERSAVDLAHTLVTHKRPVEFLDKIVQRHAAAKPDGPWIMLAGDAIKPLVLAKTLVTTVRPRTYRLDAFEQILWDVEYFDS